MRQYGVKAPAISRYVELLSSTLNTRFARSVWSAWYSVDMRNASTMGMANTSAANRRMPAPWLTDTTTRMMSATNANAAATPWETELATVSPNVKSRPA